jgi:hypothetical protein
VTRPVARFLTAFAGWTIFVWVVFIRNVVKDHTHSTGFKVVHVTLAVVSLAFAAACLWIVARARRSGRSGLSPADPSTSATPSVRQEH